MVTAIHWSPKRDTDAIYKAKAMSDLATDYRAAQLYEIFCIGYNIVALWECLPPNEKETWRRIASYGERG